MKNLMTSHMILKLSDRKFAIALTLLYAFLLGYIMSFHELWIDETEPWLLALYSKSYGELLVNKQYEGHPNLWYSILYVITRFTQNLQMLKITQFFFAIAFVFTFLRFAPFHRVVRVLFCFGYFGLFEYGVISRLYAIELFTMFSICTLYPFRFKHWWLYILALSINAHTNLFGFMFSGAIGLLLFAEALQILKNTSQLEFLSSIKKWTGFVIWIAACTISFWSMARPSEFSGFGQPGEFLNSRLDSYTTGQALTRPGMAFFPVPQFDLNFWNTSFLKSRYNVLLSFSFIALILYLLKSVPRLAITLTMLFIGLYSFFIFKYDGFMRHYAHFFLFAMAIVWILHYYRPLTKSANLSFLKLQKGLFLITSIQALVGCYAVYMEISHPFHAGKAVAKYIKLKLPADALLVTDTEPLSSTIVAYLGYPVLDITKLKSSSFFTPGFVEVNLLTPYQVLDWGRALAQRHHKSVFLISYRNIAIDCYPHPVTFISSFKKNYIVTHDYFLYQIPPLSLPKAEFIIK